MNFWLVLLINDEPYEFGEQPLAGCATQEAAEDLKEGLDRWIARAPRFDGDYHASEKIETGEQEFVAYLKAHPWPLGGDCPISFFSQMSVRVDTIPAWPAAQEIQ